MDIFLENLVLLILIIIQSIFGIGLLLFGTPTFLMLGYDFINTLNFLLPISIVISSLQLISFKTYRSKNLSARGSANNQLISLIIKTYREKLIAQPTADN